MTGIYKIENLLNHKIYIGKALNINKRFGDHRRLIWNKDLPSYNYPLYRALRKYGINNFQFSIVEECEPDDLIEKEIYWIQYYEAFGPKGYNQTPGGDGSPKVLDSQLIEQYNLGKTIEEISNYFNISKNTTIQILHRNNLAYMSQEEKNKLQNPKPVEQYSLDGNFIQEFYSAGEASRQLHYNNLNEILKACHEHCTAYNFLWKFTDDTTDINEIVKYIKEREQKRIEHVTKAILKRCSKPVNQYDLNGKYIKSYESASEARRALNNQHISDVCNGKWLTAAKYYWRYISDEFPQGQDLNLNNIENWRKQQIHKNVGGGG